MGARLGAKLDSGPNAVAFFSSGHFKLAADFSPDAQHPHARLFANIDVAQLQKVTVFDRDSQPYSGEGPFFKEFFCRFFAFVLCLSCFWVTGP